MQGLKSVCPDFATLWNPWRLKMGPNWPKIMSGKEHLVSCKISCVKFRAIFEKQFFYFFLKPTGHTVSATFFDDGSIKRRNVGSVTRWLDYYSIFGHLHRWKFAQRHTIFAKVGSKCCQIVKNHKTCPRLWGFCQIGEISPIWSHCHQVTWFCWRWHWMDIFVRNKEATWAVVVEQMAE